MLKYLIKKHFTMPEITDKNHNANVLFYYKYLKWMSL